MPTLIQQEFDLKSRQKDWERQKQILLQQYQLSQEVQDIISHISPKQEKEKKIQTSKILTFFLLFNLLGLEVFTCYITWRTMGLAFMTMVEPNFAPLLCLLGESVASIIAFLIYMVKSTRENVAGGLSYMKAQYELEQEKVQ